MDESLAFVKNAEGLRQPRGTPLEQFRMVIDRLGREGAPGTKRIPLTTKAVGMPRSSGWVARRRSLLWK